MTKPITLSSRLNDSQPNLRFWVAPLFAAALSAITLCASFLVKPQNYEVGFPAFFCFLPMTFYFAAIAQIESQKQVRALRQRVEQLEGLLCATKEE